MSLSTVWLKKHATYFENYFSNQRWFEQFGTIQNICFRFDTLVLFFYDKLECELWNYIERGREFKKKLCLHISSITVSNKCPQKISDVVIDWQPVICLQSSRQQFNQTLMTYNHLP